MNSTPAQQTAVDSSDEVVGYTIFRVNSDTDPAVVVRAPYASAPPACSPVRVTFTYGGFSASYTTCR
jgi:hypothetical protein